MNDHLKRSKISINSIVCYLLLGSFLGRRLSICQAPSIIRHHRPIVIIKFTFVTRNQRDPLLLVQPNKQALIITSLKVQIQTRVHQRLATERSIERIARIPGIAVQTLHLERWRSWLDGSVLLESEHEGLVFLLADELHGGPVGLVGQAQAVEAAGDDDGVDFLPGSEDGGDGGGFFGGEVGGL